MSRLAALTLLLLCAAPVAAQGELRDRLRALSAPPPDDPYAGEKTADLARIQAEADVLFGRDGPRLGPRDAAIAIAFFVSSDCPECPAARADLESLALSLGVGVRLVDIDASAENRAVMARLTLDVTPSYAMRDRLIRGQMPGFVLERYLSP